MTLNAYFSQLLISIFIEGVRGKKRKDMNSVEIEIHKPEPPYNVLMMFLFYSVILLFFDKGFFTATSAHMCFTRQMAFQPVHKNLITFLLLFFSKVLSWGKYDLWQMAVQLTKLRSAWDRARTVAQPGSMSLAPNSANSTTELCCCSGTTAKPSPQFRPICCEELYSPELF